MRRVLRVGREALIEVFGKVDVRRRQCIACVRPLGLCLAMTADL